MTEQFTSNEIQKIQSLCFNNPAKACAVAQLIINTLGLVSCKGYADYKKKAIRTIQYQVNRLTGIILDGRKFISINQ